MDARVAFLETVHPYNTLPQDELARVAHSFRRIDFNAGDVVYRVGVPLDGLYLVQRGSVQISEASGQVISQLGPRNSFGERGLLRDGLAATEAVCLSDTCLLLLAQAEFRRLIRDVLAFEQFFVRGAARMPVQDDLALLRLGDLISRKPLTVAPFETVHAAAQKMRDHKASSLGVLADGRLVGLVTLRDLVHKVLAAGRGHETPLDAVMTPAPLLTLGPDDLGSDVLHMMLEHHISHVPVLRDGAMIGMITKTDLTRFQALSSGSLVRDAALAEDVSALTAVTARLGQLLVRLVAAQSPHHVVTRLMTDVADTVTRRLLSLAEARLGPPPVPYVWLACGSQGRQEQTGVSDQDNCLMIDDAATAEDMPYFAALAKEVCDGLHACGYVYCPGEMMANNPRWCQPMRVWRGYFDGWIARPDPTAQMLASVMFDLRPIGGDAGLFTAFQAETLAQAARNSIFQAHMIANSLKHTPPLGLLRGFATIRSGERRDQIDMKHNGVVPVVDLGRIYALTGQLTAVNTRARLTQAESAGIMSASGARDLIAAYDLIANTRLVNQARLIRSGRAPDNFLAPVDMSDFERSHLRDAFVVVRTMQSAAGQSRGAIG